MSDAPERANHGGVAHFFVARDDRRDSDHVIGISGVAHPEKEAERDNGEQADHFSFEILDGTEFTRPGVPTRSCPFRE